MTTAVLWFRRDLRLHDNPALLAAAAEADEVLPLFVIDPTLIKASGERTNRLMASLAALNSEMNGALVIRAGDPLEVVPQVANEVNARSVHISWESTPYGRRRDTGVADELAAQDRRLEPSGSPYAVTPGRVLTSQHTPYRVFTPYRRAWARHGWPAPAGHTDVRWTHGVRSEPIDAATDSTAGEGAALERWAQFLADDLPSYAAERDRPDLNATSRLSVHLKYGEVHPRTLLADLARHREQAGKSVERFVTELAWRDFYADVLWHDPRSAWRDWNGALSGLRYDAADEQFHAWRVGRTGYPFVDAGMRQLADEGWMHNRLRMVTGSFLVKDLHIWWPLGARHFLDRLIDGDVASNNHGWQWIAGTGTDAAPYFRIFNPVIQGLRFDPHGDYVRRWVPELRHLSGAAVHEPWRYPDGAAQGYPERIIDHAQERREALARLGELKESER